MWRFQVIAKYCWKVESREFFRVEDNPLEFEVHYDVCMWKLSYHGEKCDDGI